ncbi:PP2C family protein-serine/threonine phosphatase [Mycobacterium kyorinense]|nr:GAF domain-containing SpoIIE family protein phosphatase [Mycobacterium kyorinense]
MRAVARYSILDTPPDGAFDRIARIAARVFHTAMATVTIVDTDRIWFKATHGLTDVSQIGRDPGLCASAILNDATYLVRDALTDPRTVDNPLVHGEMGIRFYAAAPIVTADGHRLGTVNVLDTEPQEPTDEAMATLAELAAITMDELELRLSALNTLRRERERREQSERDRNTIADYAAVLQRSLLPPTLPDIPGLTLAAHYYPASPTQVGGDFYDVFPLGGGRWAFFLGDVEGHGAAAAALTSLIRYTLRATALRFRDPRDALAELNAVLVRDPNENRFCTVLFGVLEPSPDGDGAQIAVATGGHPPALLLDAASGEVNKVRSARGMLVGAVADAVFDACSLRLRRGCTLLLYTDGIIEARPDGENSFGEDRLVAFASRHVRLPAPGLLEEFADLIPTLRPSDDVALLAFTAR